MSSTELTGAGFAGFTGMGAFLVHVRLVRCTFSFSCPFVAVLVLVHATICKQHLQNIRGVSSGINLFGEYLMLCHASRMNGYDL